MEMNKKFTKESQHATIEFVWLCLCKKAKATRQTKLNKRLVGLVGSTLPTIEMNKFHFENFSSQFLFIYSDELSGRWTKTWIQYTEYSIRCSSFSSVPLALSILFYLQSIESTMLIIIIQNYACTMRHTHNACYYSSKWKSHSDTETYSSHRCKIVARFFVLVLKA